MTARTAFLLASALAVGAAQAQTKWDMPTPYSDGEFHTRNVRAFAEEVKKATGGKLEINVHSNGSLIKHPDILRAVSTGQVPIAELLLGQFGNEDPVKSVSDFKGLKMRTYSPLTARLAELLGASPTVVQVPEVPQMFATGAMHAMVTSSATGTTTKAWEFVRNYYKTNAWNPKNVVVANQRAFSRLPKGEQDALVKAAAAAEPRGWDMSRAREKEGDETLAKNGVAVNEPSPQLKAALDKIGEQMAAEWEKTAGADGQAILKAYRGK